MSRRRILITAVGLTVGLAALSACTGVDAEAPSTMAAEDPAAADSMAADKADLNDEVDAAELATMEEVLLGDGGAGDITVDTDIVYREVDGEQVRLDVCRSPEDAESADPRPAVLLIHGGGFVAGDKSRPHWQLICRWLADAGYVAVNLNYRLAPEHLFPAAIEDVQAAARWTRENAATYGIDPDRIGALGGSAGANLAMLLGSSGEGATTADARVASVVSLSGAADVTEAALQLGDPDPRAVRAVLRYLGCPEISGCEAAEAASPITQVDGTDPPFLLVQSEGERLPVEQTEAMADALTAAGANPEVLIQPGTAHAARLLRDQELRDAVLDFLNRTLG